MAPTEAPTVSPPSQAASGQAPHSPGEAARPSNLAPSLYSPSQSRRSPRLSPQNRQSPRLLHKATLPVTKVNVKKKIVLRGKGRKRGGGGSPKKECYDDDNIVHLCDDLEKLAENNVCVNMTGAKDDLKCNCLHFLKDDVNARLAVSKGILGFLKKDKLDQQNTLIGWYRYASDGKNKKPPIFYPI